ncbi:hypothetical protein FOCC_FOCC016277 [Frankliniella occidentalis]|uniref:E3 SUMO-protein ligase ZBED1-like n=1 Tax=Frankliniella occidentalis TaxID=133901 RepID=A0A9C6XU99_FRAOC|nr:E3 SUMO-protein ligase ZBED1-like [Frankliniella occidentalis]KAE8738250.1 hypothetical protein FOCC_FOCC016277 [Frankliniella occidentalis]
MVKAIQTMGAPHHLCLGHGVHNLVSKDGIKGALVVDELCKKARAVCKAVRYRAPVIERENKKEQGLDWLKAVVDADEHAATDDADPIPDPPDADDSTAGGAAAAAGSGGQDRNQNQTSNGDEMFLQYPIAAAPTSVKLPVPTRWHTVLIMLESLEQNKGPVNIVLSEVGKEDLHFSNAQYSTMKSMIGFLSAFRRAVEILSAESCTLNLALLLRSELEDVLKEDEEDSLVVGDLKRRLRDRLDFRFPVNDLLVTAALLDPRCANLVIVNEYLRVLGESKAEFLARQVRYNVLESHLPDEARRGREEPVEELQAQPGPSTSRNKRKSATTAEELMNLSRKHSKSQDGTRAEAVDKEVRLYLDSCNPDDVKDNDVLAFWRGRLKQYPWLSTAVRKFLCIPATSTTAERVFSIAGLTITAKRSRLNPDRVDIIIFIHENYDICSKLFQ